MKQRLLRMAATILAFAMVCSGVTALATSGEARGFTDVPASHWAYEPIQRAADKGWVKGVGDGRFDPNGSVSSAQFVVMLTRAFYQDSVDSIVNSGAGGDKWWYASCVAGYLNGVILGTKLGDAYEESYTWDEAILNEPISRFDMAQMMLNIMSDNDFTVTESEKKAAQAKIGDWNQIPVEYRDAVSSVYALGVINGTSAGTFEGSRGMNRAESAVVLVRLNDAINTGATDPVEGQYDMSIYTVPADANKDGVLTEDEVLAKLEELKVEYPEDMAWGDDVYYRSPTMGGSYGCAAFVYTLSDAIFGNLPKRTLADISDLRAGDFIIGAKHSIMISSVVGDSYTIAEGNIGGVVAWSAKGSISLIAESTIYTRYPA